MTEVRLEEEWHPAPEVMVSLYERLARGEVLSLKWRCPGRVAPGEGEASQRDGSSLRPESDIFFDFDETPETPLQPVRTPGSSQPRGSARKKTTDFDSVISNMQRHQRMDARDSPVPIRTSTPKRAERRVPPTGGRRS